MTTGEKDKPSINGAIMKRNDKETTTIFIDAPSVNDFLKKIKQAGGKAKTTTSRSKFIPFKNCPCSKAN